MKKFKLLSCIFLSMFCTALPAQNDSILDVKNSVNYRLTNSVIWLQTGHNQTYDDYLSALLYQGSNIAVGFEQQRYYSLSGPRISKYDGVEFHFSSDLNPSETYKMYIPYLRGYYGAHYQFRPTSHFSLFLGSYSAVDLGLKYLPHNGNNPVNVIGDMNQWASAMFSYSFLTPKRKNKMRFVDHLSAPFVGMMFSPKYTELYYDMAYIDDYSGNVKMTSLGNRLQFRNAFSVEAPLGRLTTLRLGCVVERIKCKVNQLESRYMDVNFQIGVVRNFYTFKGNRSIPANFIAPY